jgi:hypothetical protein
MNGTGVVSLLTFFGKTDYATAHIIPPVIAATYNIISETCPDVLRICALMYFWEEAGVTT